MPRERSQSSEQCCISFWLDTFCTYSVPCHFSWMKLFLVFMIMSNQNTAQHKRILNLLFSSPNLMFSFAFFILQIHITLPNIMDYNFSKKPWKFKEPLMKFMSWVCLGNWILSFLDASQGQRNMVTNSCGEPCRRTLQSWFISVVCVSDAQTNQPGNAIIPTQNRSNNVMLADLFYDNIAKCQQFVSNSIHLHSLYIIWLHQTPVQNKVKWPAYIYCIFTGCPQMTNVFVTF